MLLALLPVLGIHFLLRDAQAQSVTQPDARVTVSEGASLQLRCKYSYSGTPYLFWYVQYPRQGLQLLLKYYPGDPVVQGVNGFEAEFSKSNSSFHLRKASVHWSDSAVYFCAVSQIMGAVATSSSLELGLCFLSSQTSRTQNLLCTS